MEGYINHFSKSSRILAHTKVTKLPFKFDSGQHFTIYIRPIDPDDETIDTLVTCKLRLDEESSSFPVPLYCWSPGMFVELNYVDLEQFEVYVGLQNEYECNDEEEDGHAPNPDQ